MELGAFLHSLLLRPAARDEINAFMSAWSSARSSAYSAPVWQSPLLIPSSSTWVPSSLIDVLASILTELIVGPCCPIITLDQAEVTEAFRAFDCKGNGFISAIELTRSIADTATPTASSSFYLTVGPITH
nr:probable calcium-binding protein CML12 [Oryza sativa Japonica Group]